MVSWFNDKEQSLKADAIGWKLEKKKKNLKSVTNHCGKIKGNSLTRQKYEDEITYKLLYPSDHPYIWH